MMQCSKNEDFGKLVMLAKEKGYASNMENLVKMKNDHEGPSTSVRKGT